MSRPPSGIPSQDEHAFSTLALRHAARVRSVCRRVLDDEHDAEDTCQATFLVLARKAVGPWLSVVAFRLAMFARFDGRGAFGKCSG